MNYREGDTGLEIIPIDIIVDEVFYLLMYLIRTSCESCTRTVRYFSGFHVESTQVLSWRRGTGKGEGLTIREEE